ncbi:uncharacterized protein LOC124361390 [Homalodisca vitripennis]|uniref:uncharacterized protein LOC124361390 n=1 Tax=Homalodisca vitripennis TaxID=197043 RepID=UPI001EEC0A2A|nr:uncharacterized protein LOC124361390 [Homalodisca vitripennis]
MEASSEEATASLLSIVWEVWVPNQLATFTQLTLFYLNQWYQASSEEATASLLSIVWEVWVPNQLATFTQLTLFDLNQWYREYMPQSSDIEYSHFMAHFCLPDGPLLDVSVVQSSIRQFATLQPVDEHFFPTATTFQCVCLQQTQVTTCVHHDTQEVCLQAIKDGGPSALLLPIQALHSGLHQTFAHGCCNVSLCTPVTECVFLQQTQVTTCVHHGTQEVCLQAIKDGGPSQAFIKPLLMDVQTQVTTCVHHDTQEVCLQAIKDGGPSALLLPIQALHSGLHQTFAHGCCNVSLCTPVTECVCLQQTQVTTCVHHGTQEVCLQAIKDGGPSQAFIKPLLMDVQTQVTTCVHHGTQEVCLQAIKDGGPSQAFIKPLLMDVSGFHQTFAHGCCNVSLCTPVTECVCLQQTQVTTCVHHGTQEVCLQAIKDGGPSALLLPSRLYKLCIQAGIKPLLLDVSSPNSSHSKELREYLLCVALEYGMMGFLRSCVHDWSDGSHAVAGCTLPNLLHWAWGRVDRYKKCLDGLCVPLFDYSGTALDSNDVGLFHHLICQLHDLQDLFHLVLDKYQNCIIQGNYEQQHTALSLVTQFYDSVLWCVRYNILPETNAGDTKGHIPYFTDIIVNSTISRPVRMRLPL